MVSAGDRYSAIVFRETLRKTLDEFAQSGIKYPLSVDLTDVMKNLITDAMKNTRSHEIHLRRPIYDTSSIGLIGVSIADQKLKLDPEECTNVMSSIVNGAQGKPIDEFFFKKLPLILACANKEVPYIEFDEYHQCVLFQYKLKLFDDADDDIYELTRIPFGRIVALGSGSKFDYIAHQDRTLFFALFQSGVDADVGALHLSSILELAEHEILQSTGFNFKTFGGAVVPASIITHPNGNGETRIILCDLGSKLDNRVVSRTYNKNGNIWVETRSGKNLELQPFPDKLSIKDDMSW